MQEKVENQWTVTGQITVKTQFCPCVITVVKKGSSRPLDGNHPTCKHHQIKVKLCVNQLPTYRIPQLSNYHQFNKMSWARLTKKLNRSRSVSTINNNNNNLNFEKIRTSPSISEETVNSITSALSKGGFISEGIFNLVPSSKQWTKSLSQIF